MSDLRYTLLTDGSSDRVLVPLLTWLLREKSVRAAIQPQWAELRGLPNPPRDLSGRILTCIELYPCGDRGSEHVDGVYGDRLIEQLSQLGGVCGGNPSIERGRDDPETAFKVAAQQQPGTLGTPLLHALQHALGEAPVHSLREYLV